MNYLAHLFLSMDDDDIRIGNFMADFLSLKESKALPPAIYKGILIHKEIDKFTDANGVVDQSILRLQKHGHGRYAPVIMDILYDHLLAKNWSTYADDDLQQFANEMYELFLVHMDWFPKRIQNSIIKMAEENFIPSYGTKVGIQYVLERMDKRTSFPSNFAESCDHLYQDFDQYNDEFNAFFPMLQQHVVEVYKSLEG